MLLAGEGARALGQAGATAEIVGTWRGTSRCVDRVAAPACNDEQVIYEISATPGRESAVTVNADKVVDGKRVPMGALDFARDPKDGSWKTWKLPGEKPRTYAVYVDERDIVWTTDWGADAVVSFDPKTEKFASYPMSAKGANVRQILGRPGEVWFPESGTERLMVIRTGETQ